MAHIPTGSEFLPGPPKWPKRGPYTLHVGIRAFIFFWHFGGPAVFSPGRIEYSRQLRFPSQYRPQIACRRHCKLAPYPRPSASMPKPGVTKACDKETKLNCRRLQDWRIVLGYPVLQPCLDIRTSMSKP